AEDYTVWIDHLSPHPEAAITPANLHLEAVVGGSANGGLMIENTAVATLQFDIDTALAAKARHQSARESAQQRLAALIAAGHKPSLMRQSGAVRNERGKSSQHGQTQIAQMQDNVPRSGHGVACSTGNQASTDNSWWRRFYFDEHPQVGESTRINAGTVASEIGPQIPVT